MRSDKSLSEDFLEEKTWTTDPTTGSIAPSIDRLTYYFGPDYHRHSYSGYERNRLFINLRGRDFADISGVSGIDNIADSRCWAALDFDRDGWNDIVLVNANRPLLNLYRNRIGERSDHNHIKVRLIGGAGENTGEGRWSNRDAIGAVVEVRCGGRTLRRVRSLGEGFAAQNSAVMTIGIGSAAAADSIEIHWPSGRRTTIDNAVPAGESLTLHERGDQ